MNATVVYWKGAGFYAVYSKDGGETFEFVGNSPDQEQMKREAISRFDSSIIRYLDKSPEGETNVLVYDSRQAKKSAEAEDVEASRYIRLLLQNVGVEFLRYSVFSKALYGTFEFSEDEYLAFLQEDSLNRTAAIFDGKVVWMSNGSMIEIG